MSYRTYLECVQKFVKQSQFNDISFYRDLRSLFTEEHTVELFKKVQLFLIEARKKPENKQYLKQAPLSNTLHKIILGSSGQSRADLIKVIEDDGDLYELFLSQLKTVGYFKQPRGADSAREDNILLNIVSKVETTAVAFLESAPSNAKEYELYAKTAYFHRQNEKINTNSKVAENLFLAAKNNWKAAEQVFTSTLPMFFWPNWDLRARNLMELYRLYKNETKVLETAEQRTTLFSIVRQTPSYLAEIKADKILFKLAKAQELAFNEPTSCFDTPATAAVVNTPLITSAEEKRAQAVFMKQAILSLVALLKNNISNSEDGRATRWYTEEKIAKFDVILESMEGKELKSPAQTLGMIRDLCAIHRHPSLFGGFGRTHSSKEFEKWFQSFHVAYPDIKLPVKHYTALELKDKDAILKQLNGDVQPVVELQAK